MKDTHRKRRRWSKREEDSLLCGIRIYGEGNWTEMLKDRNLYFSGRTSSDLKDKYRNILKKMASPLRSGMSEGNVKTDDDQVHEYKPAREHEREREYGCRNSPSGENITRKNGPLPRFKLEDETTEWPSFLIDAGWKGEGIINELCGERSNFYDLQANFNGGPSVKIFSEDVDPADMLEKITEFRRRCNRTIRDLKEQIRLAEPIRIELKSLMEEDELVDFSESEKLDELEQMEDSEESELELEEIKESVRIKRTSRNLLGESRSFRVRHSNPKKWILTSDPEARYRIPSSHHASPTSEGSNLRNSSPTGPSISIAPSKKSSLKVSPSKAIEPIVNDVVAESSIRASPLKPTKLSMTSLPLAISSPDRRSPQKSSPPVQIIDSERIYETQAGPITSTSPELEQTKVVDAKRRKIVEQMKKARKSDVSACSIMTHYLSKIGDAMVNIKRVMSASFASEDDAQVPVKSQSAKKKKVKFHFPAEVHDYNQDVRYRVPGKSPNMYKSMAMNSKSSKTRKSTKVVFGSVDDEFQNVRYRVPGLKSKAPKGKKNLPISIVSATKKPTKRGQGKGRRVKNIKGKGMRSARPRRSGFGYCRVCSELPWNQACNASVQRHFPNERESSTEAEQQKTFRELSDTIVTFVVETYNLVLERLNVDKEYYGKFERALSGDLGERFKVPMLFEKVLRYLRGEVPLMGQCDQLVNILRSLLHPGNHPILRREGMRLLMFWLRDEQSALPDTITLFASCIPLQLFAREGTMIQQKAYPLAPENEPPLFPAPPGYSPMDGALFVLEVMLDFITFDVDADRGSTGLLYGLFRQHYLSIMYPTVCKQVGLIESTYGRFITGCPPELQAVVMRHFAMWMVQPPELFTNVGGSSIPVATFILQDILLSSAPDLELIHEVIGQSLQLPFAYKGTIGIAIGMLRTWIFNSKERRPVFLQGIPSHPPTKALCEREGIRVDDVLDWYLQRYMRLIGGLFDGRSAPGKDHTNQIMLYREGIYFLRGVAMSAFFTLNRDSWNQLLIGTILEIMKTHLASNLNKYAIIADPEAAEDFSQLLAETLFGAWIRSETMVQGNWERLAVVLGTCTRWSLVVDEWCRILMTLTNLMAEVVFKVDAAKPATEEPSKKRQIRNGTFESAQLATLLTMNTPIGRAMAAELSNPMATRSLPATATDRPSDHFLSWSELPWIRENVVFLWRNMLRALGDINSIERPDIHETALTCVVRVIERLLAIRDMQPYFCRPLPPLYEATLILLDACDLPPKTYERSRCLAFSAVCRLFVRRHDMSFPDYYIPRFYLALVNGLADKDDPVATVILLCASHLFGRRLPGAAILVPPLLKCMAGMLNSQIPADRSGVLVPMMRLVETIGVAPVTVPRIEAPLPIMSAVPISCAGEMGAAGVRMQVKDLLFMMDLQDGTRTDPPTHSAMLSVVNVLLCDELLVQKDSNPTLVDGYLNVLLDHMLPKDSPLLHVIFDQFYALAQMLPLFGASFGVERQTLVVQRLIVSIRTTASNPELSVNEQDALLTEMVQMLLEWLMALKPDFLAQNHPLREQVFSVLEECLGRRSGPIIKSHSALAPTPSPKKDRPNLTSAESDTEQDENCFAREAAEFALVHLTHHMNNFAPEYGPTVVSSLVPDADERVLYFSLNESALLAVQQIPGCVRVTVRNAAGRFTWDSHSFYETFQHRESLLFPKDRMAEWHQVGILPELKFERAVLDKVPLFKPLFIGLTRPKFVGVPMLDVDIDLERTDMLHELLVYLGKEHPHCINKDERSSLVDANRTIPESRKDNADKIMEQSNRQIEAERAIAKKYMNWEYHGIAKPARPNPVTPLPPYQLCRQFLAQYGFLTPINGQAPPLRVLTKTSGMMRDLKGLDAKFARETIKIGVLYVAPGQEDETSILRNTEGSAEYKTFLRTLGWMVDLTVHPGYTGGLEPGMTVENRALFNCTSTVECIFHDATTIIVPQADEKMLAKKRHIGNDHVHIVWNEHYRDYRPVIRGDYGNVQIIITPLDGGVLYRVAILRDSHAPVFGPIIDGMVLPRALLGTLVRATAINAHRSVMKLLRGSHHVLTARARDIALIVRRHAQRNWSLEQFLAHVMFAAGSPDEMKSAGELMERMTLDVAHE